MPPLDRDQVLSALNTITDPMSGKGLAEAGMVRALIVLPERTGFMLEVPEARVTEYGPVRLAAEKLLKTLPGVGKVQVVLTAEMAAAPQAGKAPSAKLSERAVEDSRPKAPVASSRPNHVKHVIVVGSGKGGVGKSSLSLGLAIGLSQLGLKIGLLDADIYGPSAPVMLGLSKPPEFGADKLMVPPEAFGLKVNSVGFLVDPDQAMIWRGPMASQALTQLLTQTRWGTAEEPLDVLVIDLPPGTGDVQLTLTQKTLIDGAVVVSTPQEMALADARRAVTLFGKTGVKVLGVIENMAYLTGPDGSEIEVFGRGGAKAMAGALDVAFLGEVPLDPALRKGCDAGRPLTALEPEGEMAGRFRKIAEAVMAALGA
ncbi:Mrp/NBP35 family ATP-binding protein [Asticcacaulis sp. EMRT-3]|uniref:Mrp/NBP35 family ATP-binding protein n=1 Tax=Asticcacaulis sp. EMRT-3 TaxID=3040349 RepID=UPI0024AF619E|nr:Mrp/NBP35 family ATP-binding protein [Asticcacaulis sp. EMRT-3]MDI7775241.1 Mrp/NBP35 family ATP-binding protein [Asticcacaulis sp. EMRT-3]